MCSTVVPGHSMHVHVFTSHIDSKIANLRGFAEYGKQWFSGGTILTFMVSLYYVWGTVENLRQVIIETFWHMTKIKLFPVLN
jgi:hypothetical protein